jgi:hypothetical protein
MSPISAAMVRGQHPSDPGRDEQQRHVGVFGAAGLELAVDLGDEALEFVDRLEAGIDRAAPWLRDLEPVKQLAAGDAEQVGDRAGMPEGDHRRMDAALQAGLVLDQVQPEARLLALAPHSRIGQPDRRHQIAMREHREDLRVDRVGLARQRRQALDLLRVGDRHLPAQPLQAVVHEPRAGHRLDHPAHRSPHGAIRPTRPRSPSASGGAAKRPTTSPARRSGRRRAACD